MFESSEVPPQEQAETQSVEKSRNPRESFKDSIEKNVLRLREAVKNNDRETIDLLGLYIEQYTMEENEIIKSISQITDLMKESDPEGGPYAIHENSKIEFEIVLDVIREFISEYRSILLEQVETESEK